MHIISAVLMHLVMHDTKIVQPINDHHNLLRPLSIDQKLASPLPECPRKNV